MVERLRTWIEGLNYQIPTFFVDADLDEELH
jgi:hypothetical protein